MSFWKSLKASVQEATGSPSETTTREGEQAPSTSLWASAGGLFDKVKASVDAVDFVEQAKALASQASEIASEAVDVASKKAAQAAEVAKTAVEAAQDEYQKTFLRDLVYVHVTPDLVLMEFRRPSALRR